MTPTERIDVYARVTTICGVACVLGALVLLTVAFWVGLFQSSIEAFEGVAKYSIAVFLTGACCVIIGTTVHYFVKAVE